MYLKNSKKINSILCAAFFLVTCTGFVMAKNNIQEKHANTYLHNPYHHAEKKNRQHPSRQIHNKPVSLDNENKTSRITEEPALRQGMEPGQHKRDMKSMRTHSSRMPLDEDAYQKARSNPQYKHRARQMSTDEREMLRRQVNDAATTYR